MISLDAINSALEVAEFRSSSRVEEKAAHQHTASDNGNDDFESNNESSKPVDTNAETVLSFQKRLKGEVLLAQIEALPLEAQVLELADRMGDATALDYTAYKELLQKPMSSTSITASAVAEGGDIRKYLSPKTFLLLPKDVNGCVTSQDLLKFVTKCMDVEEVGLNLLRHCIIDDADLDGPAGVSRGWGVHGVSGSCGFISEAELERYLFELIPRLHSCQDFDYNFYPFYSYAASRCFFFHLDPLRSHRLSVHKLAHSRLMEEFVSMRREPQGGADSRAGGSGTEGWFHGEHVQRVYNTYLSLDTDSNGTLSAEELHNFSGVDPADSVRFTHAAIQRLLEETVAYSPVEMDFKGFLDLVLALQNKGAAQSVSYFWNAINVDKSGRLSPSNITYFYKEVHTSLREHGCDAPEVENVVAEIYDILACQDPLGPTLKDVVKSGQGGTVMSMLLDVTGFWQYDNRESLIAQQQGTQ